jgi:hypothetical protein
LYRDYIRAPSLRIALSSPYIYRFRWDVRSDKN